MKIIRKDYIARIPKNIEIADGLNRGDYNWILSVFIDKDWDLSIPRDSIIHFAGSGVREPYPTDSTAVLSSIEMGRFFCTLNYSGQEGTTSPPWINGWGNYSTHFLQYVARLSFEVQSAIDTLIDIADKEDSLNIRDIYLSGKSRGGASVVFWSGISETTHIFSENNNRVKGIVNQNGVSGSGDNTTWVRPSDSMTPLLYGMNHSRFPMVHVYNDGDTKGNSDFRRKLQFGIWDVKRKLNYFYNFTNGGHTTDWNFLQQMITCWSENRQLEYQGKLLLTE